MPSDNRVDRREFIRSSAVAVAAGLGVSEGLKALGLEASADTIEEAVRAVGRLPRRKFDSWGRDISVLVGAADWHPDAIEAGIRCGVNYWHKAQHWQGASGLTGRSTPEAILKNRDAHYVEVCVDRVRGNHETGEIDEEEHYQLVKGALKRTGVGYFDDMLFHFGYHNVAEYKTNKAFMRAYERLKKEGLVRHLCLSQHSYNGNPKVPGGESAAEILTAILEDGLYEHAQFFFSYGDDEAINKLVDVAHRKGLGTIAMKTSRGAGRMLQDNDFMKNFPPGTTPHHALARWLTTRTKLTAAVIAIANLQQFVDTYSGAGKGMRAADFEALRQMTAYADREVCRLCNQCLSHCGQRVPIADILRYERYARDYGEAERAKRLYAQLDKQGNACIACGTCLPHCPQGLNIPAKVADAHRILS
jgi:predicted aldo/keto reductase-like oxidoreductase